MAQRFNPPPNWPQPQPGWQPPAGWKPDPAWGPPPPGWPLWVDELGRPAAQLSSSRGKTLWIILGGVAALFIFCIIGIFAIGGGGDDKEPAARTTTTTSAPSSTAATTEPAETTTSAPPAEPAAPGIGVPVRDGKFEFTVTGVERPGKVIGPEFLQEEAQGEFIIVRVNVTNIGDEAQTLDATGQVLINDKGQELEASSAYFVLEDADKFFLENINPGNTVTGAPLLFDVAPGTVLDSIELHDSFFSGGVKVSLKGS